MSETVKRFDNELDKQTYTQSVGGGHTGDLMSEQINPNFFNGDKFVSHNPGVQEIMAGSSPKIGGKA